LADGTVFDSSSGRESLCVTLGRRQVIRWVDDALVGMAPGDEKAATLAPDEA
jgi:peptidylprolyl isomerase